MLKNLRIKANHSNIEYKITGLSDLPCRQQMLVLDLLYQVLFFSFRNHMFLFFANYDV